MISPSIIDYFTGVARSAFSQAKHTVSERVDLGTLEHPHSAAFFW